VAYFGIDLTGKPEATGIAAPDVTDTDNIVYIRIRSEKQRHMHGTNLTIVWGNLGEFCPAFRAEYSQHLSVFEIVFEFFPVIPLKWA